MRRINNRIGVDLGGSKTEVAVLDAERRELLRERVATPAGDYARTVDTIVDLVRRAQAVSGPQSPVGIGTPGSASKSTGLIINANSTVLIGKPLQRDIESALGLSVRMTNDANCFVLSEATDGAAKDADVVFGAILGTGVGGGIAVGKRVISGTNGIAGEWGHNPLPWPTPEELPGPHCYCGKRGCIETFLSGPALAREQARVGGQTAMERYHDRLARALAAIVNVLDPQTIVLGGGVSNLPTLYEAVPRLLPQYVFSDSVRTTLLPAAHGDSSGVRGAALLWEEGAYDG